MGELASISCKVMQERAGFGRELLGCLKNELNSQELGLEVAHT